MTLATQLKGGTNMHRLLDTLAGASFVGVDAHVKVTLLGGKKNLHCGRVTKASTGHQVMVFTNTNSNGYQNMIFRRLEKEGKDPASFVLQPRKWGTRIPGLPIIHHINKEGIERHYIEMIFLKGGTAEYFLDGQPIDKDQIIGLPESVMNEDSQGGVENKVIIRSFALDSLVKVRYDSLHTIGPFYYKAP